MPTHTSAITSQPTNSRSDNATLTRPTKRRSSNRLMFCFSAIAVLLIMFTFWGHQKLESQHPSQTDKDNSAISPILWTYETRANKTSSVSTQKGKPTNHACDGYRGVYHIEKGDIGGAAGTIFFQFVIGQLTWAELHNFKPWVFLNNVSYVIYDPIVHGRGPGVDVDMMGGMNISYIRRPNGHWRDAHPGPPL
jgi:hypothetical protein